jgi:hypothetical protein
MVNHKGCCLVGSFGLVHYLSSIYEVSEVRLCCFYMDANKESLILCEINYMSFFYQNLN